ncbi:Glycosyltransferase involved in cell wall bisynthesis [Actinokineospora alba]|uniref:Glycosyltransferase involved in cell wall bisynthesis n=1 Tax=Actinokineospora alba TaxID=504798 RepID=A0A1H0HYD2_9PSEU|nr:glycosyltransferase [Actinokineospora alba]TDP64690.1 glycosyltransferase involved in cell wall biosynthesis [Actinokineospora alba]SDI83978.1 Glycosyltransferase involved in cell wall bisynthesis [Actinokineospora alba]SDO24212.1 Glycosyltransferase involved in cell wall bisynthesis [Actinokineospora alba]
MTQPVTAGVAAVVLDLAVAQQRSGWSVGIVCPPEGWLAERAREARIEVWPWAATRMPRPSSAAEAVRLRRILHKASPDVVHLHSSKAGLVGRVALRGRVPTIFQPHLWSFQTAGGLLRRACGAWERVASRWTHQLVCVSDDELAAGRAVGVSGAAEVVCNGVDTGRLRPGDRAAARTRLGLHLNAPTVVCVGRLARLKGQDQLLAAWPAILAAVPTARLVFVGDGPMGDTWRERIAVARHESVQWRGHCDAVADFYTAADVVALPSRAEGMALVPLEAMACGRSVVAFDVGGVRQSVASAGAVVPEGSVPALAFAIVRRLADPAFAAREGELARLRAETLFDRDRATEQIATLVEKLVSPRESG